MEQKGNQGRTMDRALDVLECVAAVHEPISLTRISRSTGLHLATTQRLVGQLVRRDYMRSSPLGYTLGPRVLPLSRAYVLQDRLALIAPSVLSVLTAQTSLTSSVFVRTGDERVLVARVESPNPLSYQFPVGQLLGLFIGGGKVLLAFASEDDQERLLSQYEPITFESGRIQDRGELRSDLERIVESGVHVAVAERRLESVSITAPIWHPGGGLLGSINLVTDAGDIDGAGILKFKNALVQASRRITVQM